MSCYLPLVNRWRKPDRRLSSKEPAEIPSPEISADKTAVDKAVPSTFPGSDCSHIHATRDGAGLTLSQGLGDFPHQVFLNIRHNHPTLGLGDVAFQRLHQGHTHQTVGRGGQTRVDEDEEEEGGVGVVSLGLPLGISSLKLTGSAAGRKKNKREKGGGRAATLYRSSNNNNNNNNTVDSGHFSDGELLSRERGYSRQQAHAVHLQQQQQLFSWHQRQGKQQQTQQQQHRAAVVITRNLPNNAWAEEGTTKKVSPSSPPPPAGRKSSLPRKAKIPSSYLWRPLSVDAELMLESVNKSAPREPQPHSLDTGGVPEGGYHENRGMILTSSEDGGSGGLRYAQLTSTRDYMAAQTVGESSAVGEGTLERSSSGNSSGCDLSTATNTTVSCASSSSSSFSSEDGLPAAAEDTSEKQPLGRVEQVNNSDRRGGTHPAVQGRVRGQVGPLPVNRGPPPRHLLPQRLRPSPGRKLHPLVILPPHIRKGTLHSHRAEDKYRN
jgi:hypothetical protein